jgi:hypothetical protein
LIAKLGRIAPRDRELISGRHCMRQTRSVCARERSDEAIQLSLSSHNKLDCFASLAMTACCLKIESEALIGLRTRLIPRPSSPGLTGRPSIPETVMFDRETAATDRLKPPWIARSSRATTGCAEATPPHPSFLRRGSLTPFAPNVAYSAASTAFAISAVPLLPPNSIGLIPSA